MPDKEIPKTRWKTKAVKLSSEYTPGSIVIDIDPELEIRELARSVDLDTDDKSKKDKDPYGKAITPGLAIALIADLQYRIQLFFAEFENLFSEKKSNNFSDSDIDWLKELLIRSSAITIDKNIILKTISQPGCEGVRFYLCRKVIPNPKETEKETSFLSLVTVGVDCKGQDLHYEYKEGKLQEGLLSSDLENTSILSEYGSPPPPNGFAFKKFKEFDERFAIYRYAMDEVENINKVKSSRLSGK